MNAVKKEAEEFLKLLENDDLLSKAEKKKDKSLQYKRQATDDARKKNLSYRGLTSDFSIK